MDKWKWVGCYVRAAGHGRAIGDKIARLVDSNLGEDQPYAHAYIVRTEAGKYGVNLHINERYVPMKELFDSEEEAKAMAVIELRLM